MIKKILLTLFIIGTFLSFFLWGKYQSISSPNVPSELKNKIVSVETDVVRMKNNLNAISGAIQQSDKLIKIASEHGQNDDWINDFYKQHLKEKKKNKK